MRDRQYKHHLCEQLVQVDIRKLSFDSNGPAWQYPAGTIAVNVGAGDEAHFIHDDLDYRVPVMRTLCNYGGGRPWFLCLTCGDRRAILYRPRNGGHLACRRCLKLLYLSECEDAFGRAILKVRKIERRICNPGTGLVGSAPPAEKPKGQHWSTYWRRIENFESARVAFWQQYREDQLRG